MPKIYKAILDYYFEGYEQRSQHFQQYKGQIDFNNNVHHFSANELKQV
jgi:hypothetical protein